MGPAGGVWTKKLKLRDFKATSLKDKEVLYVKIQTQGVWPHSAALKCHSLRLSIYHKTLKHITQAIVTLGELKM